ncbi:MAG: DUF2283 domain-containing protein, partial [Chloroflexota bacterium]
IMQMTYDSTTDAMYIQLTNSPVIRSQQINPNFALDLDENSEIVGIEMLNVRKSGIDPLALEVVQTTSIQEVLRPDQEAIRQGRIAKMEALKRQKQTEKQKN